MNGICCNLRHRGLCAWFFLKPVHPPAVRGVADGIIVEKRAHRMRLFSHGLLLRSYTVALGRGGSGPKQQAGDNRVPEGAYRIIGRNAHSAFHLSLRIGYSREDQVIAARRRGIDLGGDVMIHGIRRGLGWLGPWQRKLDWTRGCVALTDREVEEVWTLVPDGTPVLITP